MITIFDSGLQALILLFFKNQKSFLQTEVSGLSCSAKTEMAASHLPTSAVIAHGRLKNKPNRAAKKTSTSTTGACFSI